MPVLMLVLPMMTAVATGRDAAAQETHCPNAGGLERTWRPNLYCVDLIPVPQLHGATGTVQLLPVQTPFDVSVDRDGHMLYKPSITIRDLPDPHTLGPYTTYVAWVSTVVLKPMVKLGEVRNGQSIVGQIGFDQFMVFITAEVSAGVRTRGGKLVLRGMSPSARMRPTDLLMMTNSPGNGHGAHHMSMERGALMWSMPPMDSLLPTTPWLEGLQPTTKPFLPAPNASAPASARSIIKLAEGDTLRLAALPVNRTIHGHTVSSYGYNGQASGPLIDVAQGANIVVDFRNAIDQPTSVHWHGIRLENRFDGVPGLTQDAVKPGESFEYRLRFPDAGIYWYHAHVREDVQQALGLFGNIIVRPSEPDYYPRADREEALVLSDLLMSDDGVFPFGSGTATHALMGRFGNTFLVNGQADYRLSVRAGSVVRFYLTNASNVRPYNISFGSAPMKVIAADAGRLEHELFVRNVTIAPAQRYIVDVRFPTSGNVALENRVQVTNHAYGNLFSEVDTLARIRVQAATASKSGASAAFAHLRTNGAVQSEMAKYKAYVERAPDHRLGLTLRVDSLPLGLLLNTDTTYFAPVEWGDVMQMMSWLPTGREVRWILRDLDSGKENEAIDWKFRVGDVVKIRLFNDPGSFHPMQHPIHLHGQRFIVLSKDGVPNENFVWKDTVLVPVGSTVDILLDVSNPGHWMLHCHIAEHMETGMHAMFEVTQ